MRPDGNPAGVIRASAPHSLRRFRKPTVLPQRAGPRRTGAAAVCRGSALPCRKRRKELLQSFASTLLAAGSGRTTASLQQFHGVSTLLALVLEYGHLSILNHSKLL